MKPLFFFLFVALTVAAYADSDVVPPACCSTVPSGESATITRIPVHFGERLVIPTTYTVEKPTEKPMEIPKPLAPLLPLHTEEKRPETVRAQARTVDRLAELLDEKLPIAQGTVELETIDPKLIEKFDSSELGFDELGSNVFPAGHGVPETKSADPLGDGIILAVLVVTVVGLVYMIFVAYDYRQRWMQSLTAQNERYLGGGAFDFEMEDTFSSPAVFSEGFGLTRRSSI